MRFNKDKSLFMTKKRIEKLKLGSASMTVISRTDRAPRVDTTVKLQLESRRLTGSIVSP